MYILSFDFGTSSVKIAVLNEKLDTVQKTKKEYFYTVIENDQVEIDPVMVFQAAVAGVRELNNDYLEKIDIITFDVFSPSLVALDEEGNPVYPCILHLDRRSRAQSQEIITRFGKQEFMGITGVLPFAGGVSITSLLWLKENRPAIYRQTYKFGHFNTFIFKKLTGHWGIDPVNASMTGLYETTTWGSWSKEICTAFGISTSKLPEIYETGTMIAGLKEKVSREFGLKAGIPVLLGSNDAATGILGAGIVENGDILNIAGSNEILTILTNKPVINEGYYLRNSLFPGKWQIFSVNIGGFALEWFRQLAYSEMDRGYFYETLIREIIDGESSKGFVRPTVKFKPYLAGDRHSLEVRRGVFTDLTLSTTRDEMLKAILCGINEHIINSIEIARQFLTLNRKIIITGGLAETPYLKVKEKILPEFTFEFKQRCTTVGNGKLALSALNSMANN
jgi:sugar (pentulose or hexulose) kinase